MESSKRSYTDDEIYAMTTSDGYIQVHPKLWDRLPARCHVRYVKRGEGPRGSRFNVGVFVVGQIVREDKKMFSLSSKPTPGGHAFNIYYDTIETLWKKTPPNSCIELYLINNSLMRKTRQIATLEARVEALDVAVTELTAMLVKVGQRASGTQPVSSPQVHGAGASRIPESAYAQLPLAARNTPNSFLLEYIEDIEYT